MSHTRQNLSANFEKKNEERQTRWFATWFWSILNVHINVHVLPTTQLDIVSVLEQPLYDGAVCHAYYESTTSQSQLSNQIMVNEVKLYIESFMSEMTKWD
jgi:hypothetical protein